MIVFLFLVTSWLRLGALVGSDKKCVCHSCGSSTLDALGLFTLSISMVKFHLGLSKASLRNIVLGLFALLARVSPNFFLSVIWGVLLVLL